MCDAHAASVVSNVENDEKSRSAKTLVRWYEQGRNVERELPKLAAYLGHVHVADTYWYIEAVPPTSAARRGQGSRSEHDPQRGAGTRRPMGVALELIPRGGFARRLRATVSTRWMTTPRDCLRTGGPGRTPRRVSGSHSKRRRYSPRFDAPGLPRASAREGSSMPGSTRSWPKSRAASSATARRGAVLSLMQSWNAFIVLPNQMLGRRAFNQNGAGSSQSDGHVKPVLALSNLAAQRNPAEQMVRGKRFQTHVASGPAFQLLLARLLRPWICPFHIPTDPPVLRGRAERG